MKEPRANILCRSCRRYRPIDRMGIRDRVDERGGEVTELVCRRCQKDEGAEGVLVTRWRSANEKVMAA